MMYRKQIEIIKKDLDKKMVFLVGPRQVGKTWLAKEISTSFKNSLYLNYDHREDREIILDESWLDSTDLLIFDELHKMPQWKEYIKGVFDTKPESMKILVTGSARLDTFRQGGDSLAGRFFTHRLLPLTPSEVAESDYSDNTINRFLERGGFPEPFLAEELVDANRWRNEYVKGLVREDILHFEKIQDFRAIELVLQLLRSRVGSPISYKSIAEDVGISPNSVKKYIMILESLYIVFRITPHSRNIARSLLKEPKLYFFDTGLVEGDDGVKFENMVALSLYKELFRRVDSTGVAWELHYLRTKEGREVDFCIVKNGELDCMIEVKNQDQTISKHLYYFKEKYGIRAIQLVKELRLEKNKNGVEVRRGFDFLIHSHNLI